MLKRLTPREFNALFAAIWALIWVLLVRLVLHAQPTPWGVLIIAAIIFLLGEARLHVAQATIARERRKLDRAAADGRVIELGFGFAPERTLLVRTNLDPLPDRIVVVQSKTGVECEFKPRDKE